MAVNSVNFNDVLTFTRASVGWYWDGSGVLQSAAIDTPRFTHEYNGSSWVNKGILIEKPSTNIFLNSGAPATQTVSVTNGDAYVVSCYGNGYLAAETGGNIQEKNSSGFSWDASTSSPDGVVYVTEGGAKHIEALSTSFVCNVSGVVNYAQVETADQATSIIITTASPVTRAEESLNTKESV